MRRALNGLRSDEAVDNILTMFSHTPQQYGIDTNGKKDKINLDNRRLL